jgi:hypothetical protein
MTPTLDPAPAAILRAGLALLFFSAAAHKLRDRASFGAALAAYELLPAALVDGATVAIIGLELALAAGILLERVTGVAAALVLAGYTTAIAINLWRGRRDIACGCAGPAAATRLSPGLVARNLALIGLALLAALPVSARPLLWLDAVTIAAGIAVLCLLYVAVETIASLPRRARRWGRGATSVTDPGGSVSGGGNPRPVVA